MSIVSPLSPSWYTAARASSVRAEAAQKPGMTGGFDGESHHHHADGEKFHTVFATSGLHQSGTETIVSNGYDEMENPGLRAIFVAQLLGQIMPHRELKLSEARAAYGRIEQKHALLLDTRL